MVAPAASTVGGLVFADPVLEASVRDGLERVEARLRAATTGEFDFITEAARHLVLAGGKRFRPLLALLAAQFGDDPVAHGVLQSAAVIELTHLATLYHDDVMDEATARRGAVSANSRWGNTVAILTGDFLFARASDMISELGPEAVRIQARTFGTLVTGQIRETAGPAPGEDPIDHHLLVLDEKTGSLISTSALFGAMFAGVPESQAEALRRYGEAVGIAFQLSDDLLDITAEQTESGKVPGTDLREGIPTLPALFALRSQDPADARLRELLSAPVPESSIDEALRLLRGSPAVDAARDVLRSYAERARGVLTELPDVPARAALEALADFVVSRTA